MQSNNKPVQPASAAVLYGNTHQKEKSNYILQILNALRKRGIRIFIDCGFAEFLQHTLGLDITDCCAVENVADTGADVAISVGGDGTFLQTAMAIADSHIPIIGINTGHLGFLADVAPEEIDMAVELLHSREYITETHSLLKVSAENALLDIYPYALNEVSFLKTDSASLITVHTFINGADFTNYIADGLIVSTPTGSTGYSLSANGPIISPDSRSFCITPIAPHSLSIRPFIINDDATIRLTVSSRTGNFLLSIDGRSQTLSTDAVIEVSRAPYTIQVVKIKHRNFFDTLKDKLHWGTDGRS